MFISCFGGSLILLVHQVRDTKIKVLASLKQETCEERSEWKELSALLKVSTYNFVQICFLPSLYFCSPTVIGLYSFARFFFFFYVFQIVIVSIFSDKFHQLSIN